MFSLVWKGPEVEDRQLLDLERTLETQWNAGEFSKQDPTILILKSRVADLPPIYRKGKITAYPLKIIFGGYIFLNTLAPLVCTKMTELMK